ncbi:MAG TPA: hypothetical protein VI685_22535 [Candidatus Angelobacter sp.]
MFCVGLYSLALLGSLFAILICCELVGYLPYSDRPGPGWGPPQIPPWSEIRFYADWELATSQVFFFLGAIFFVYISLLAFFQAPQWMARTLAGLLCGLLSLIATAAAGWYIALAAFPANAAGFVGVLFGIFIALRFTAEEKVRLPFWRRTVGISMASLGFAAYLLYPLLR